MEFTVAPMPAGCGADVSGLSMAQPLERPVIKSIYKAWLEHIVLVFRDQTLSEDAQRRAAGYFGKLGERARPAKRRPEGRDYDGRMMLVSNARGSNGEPLGSLGDGELWFHHDMSYTPAPHKATFLYAMQVPSRGGNTMFTNMYLAYDLVPPALKERLAGRKALHLYDFATTGRLDPDTVDLSRIKHQWQPVFAVHPETGRTALYVNRLMSARIEGLPRHESDAILEELFAIAEDPSILYEHVWCAGDLVMWDNRCSTHARAAFPAAEVRMLRRCTVEGAPMVAAD